MCAARRPWLSPKASLLLLLLAGGLLSGCSQPDATRNAAADAAATTPASPDTPAPAAAQSATSSTDPAMNDTSGKPLSTTQTATFGNGCFWCTEAVLEQLDGVLDVVAGYAGGSPDNPTYAQVCSGQTGHAEVVEITFDPAVISFASLCDWFFKSHDPTTLNRQGADVGTQYRSVIFFHSEAQKATALAAIEKAQADCSDPIVTELTPAPKFFAAELYHQDYFRNNPNERYCRVMIAPKLQKLGLTGKK